MFPNAADERHEETRRKRKKKLHLKGEEIDIERDRKKSQSSQKQKAHKTPNIAPCFKPSFASFLFDASRKNR